MRLQMACAYAAALATFIVGCGEDVSQTDLAKLREIAPPAAKEQKAPDNPFAVSPDASQNPDALAGYGSTATPANTYGHGAPILLKSEVQQADVVVADGKVGRRGQGYGGGIITEPISQYFQIQTRIEFINMKNTLKTGYRPYHNDKNPPTVEEFDREVLKPSGVTLPELSPGQFYVYDPDAKDLDLVLMVGQNKPSQ